MIVKAFRHAQEAQQEASRFAFLHRPDVILHLPLSTDKPGNEPAVLAEACAVWGKRKNILPPNEFSAHLEDWPVRVDATSLVKKGARIFDVVEDDEWLAGEGDVNYWAWRARMRMAL